MVKKDVHKIAGIIFIMAGVLIIVSSFQQLNIGGIVRTDLPEPQIKVTWFVIGLALILFGFLVYFGVLRYFSHILNI